MTLQLYDKQFVDDLIATALTWIETDLEALMVELEKKVCALGAMKGGIGATCTGGRPRPCETALLARRQHSGWVVTAPTPGCYARAGVPDGREEQGGV